MGRFIGESIIYVPLEPLYREDSHRSQGRSRQWDVLEREDVSCARIQHKRGTAGCNGLSLTGPVVSSSALIARFFTLPRVPLRTFIRSSTLFLPFTQVYAPSYSSNIEQKMTDEFEIEILVVISLMVVSFVAAHLLRKFYIIWLPESIVAGAF